MGFKDLFIVNDENEKVNDSPQVEIAKQTTSTATTKFPSSTTHVEESGSILNVFGFGKPEHEVSTPIPTASVSNEHLEKALELYQKGFDSLNQPGYDFYEFYQAVMQAGPTNPQIYTMAFTMASAMDKTISKDRLVQQSDYYLTEIEKVYNDYVGKGNSKKEELLSQKKHENESLMGELSLLKQQLEAITTQIADRENKLSVIDVKYSPMIGDVEGKISANQIAKTKIAQSIEQVKNGIINNLK